MANTSDKRDIAIKALQERELQEKLQKSAEQDRHREEVQRQQEIINIWAVTTSAVISSAVVRVSNDLARRGSPLLFSLMPTTERGKLLFELRRSGSLIPSAYLQFAVDINGKVSAETNAQGAGLPPAVPLNDITAHWVEGIADEVFLSVAENRGIRVPD